MQIFGAGAHRQRATVTAMHTPQRIACLTSEIAETLYLLGEEDRIVGISGFTTRPARARREKPKISGFSSAKIDNILAVQPDLVLGFSNLQGDIARDLIQAGIEVHIFNQRTISGILRMIATLGALVGAHDKAHALINELTAGLDAIRAATSKLPRRPKIYFEEWHDPLYSAIPWVMELIEIAGGENCFPEFIRSGAARERKIEDSNEVIRRQPDIIIGSWCGKKFQPEQVIARAGWDAIPAVRDGQVFEIKSPLILTPGPAALTEGVKQLQKIIADWARDKLR